jgi:hypothetical protein
MFAALINIFIPVSSSHIVSLLFNLHHHMFTFKNEAVMYKVTYREG